MIGLIEKFLHELKMYDVELKGLIVEDITPVEIEIIKRDCMLHREPTNFNVLQVCGIRILNEKDLK